MKMKAGAQTMKKTKKMKMEAGAQTMKKTRKMKMFVNGSVEQ